MTTSRWMFAVTVALFVSGCATTKPINLKEPRRVVGTENDVRIDAEIDVDRLSPSQTINLKYDISNQRQLPIAIADIVPESTYDSDTRTVTIGIGTEVPGEEMLPRLMVIAPGEKKSFVAAARIHILVPAGAPSPFIRYPNALRVKVNFLGDTGPFVKLISIPERGIHDPHLADELFPMWLERNETVITGTVPMRWAGSPDEPQAPVDTRGRRRRGPG
ncbi:MAG: hypothetical protein ACXVIJ_05090 [Thermoanaerobaculia bacterium]